MTPRGLFPQLLLDVNDELIVDLFAGGGGASLGIEMATGRQVDVAVNHDAAAVALHAANHPQTRHLTSDVFEVDPREVTQGRPVGLLWASPDCTDFSKAKGGKPIRNKKRRALAWVVKRWAAQVRPRVIMLENVEEFLTWGPLHALRCRDSGRVVRIDKRVADPGERTPYLDQQLGRDPRRAARTFRRFVRHLRELGYVVEWRELRACDYGAPTIRKRLFLIARRDGSPIVWPEPTHGPSTRRPYRTTAECIDWSIPMLSIFATRTEARAWGKAHGQATPVRPLAEATMRRIARGVQRFVLENPRPFIVPLTHRDGFRGQPLEEPLRTVTAARRGEQALVSPFLAPRYGERPGQAPRTRSLEEPAPVVVPTGNGDSLVAAHLQAYYSAKAEEDRGSDLGEPAKTITAEPRHALVASFLARHFTGVTGAELSAPAPTVTTIDHHSLVAAHLTHQYSSNTRGGNGDPNQPAKTVVTGGHHGLVYSFLQRYNGIGVGQAVDQPALTLSTKDRLGLVTVEVAGEPYVVADIAMRMLQPRELFRAQGFPDSYVIDRGADGKRLTKTVQVRLVGNSVSPDVAAAIVGANVPELRVRDEVAA